MSRSGAAVAVLDANGLLKPSTLPSSVAFKSITDYGIVADWKRVTDGVMSAGSAVLQSSSAPFSPSDVGKTIEVAFVGASRVVLQTTILSYTDSSHVTLSVSATLASPPGGVSVQWGTAILSALNTLLAGAAAGTIFYAPSADYYCPTAAANTSIVVPDKIVFLGPVDRSARFHRIRNDPVWVTVGSASNKVAIAAGGGVLASDAAAYQNQITLTDASTVKAGDYGVVSSTLAWPDTGGGGFYGERVRVQTVDGNVVTLTSPLDEAYATANAATFAKINDTTGHMADLTFIGERDTGGNDGCIDAIYCRDYWFDLDIQGMDNPALQTDGCQGGGSHDLHVKDLSDTQSYPAWNAAKTYKVGDLVRVDSSHSYRSLTNSNLNHTPTGATDANWMLLPVTVGYGVNNRGPSRSQEFHINAERCRHAYTTSGSADGVPHHTDIYGIATETSSAGWDTHGDGRFQQFHGVEAYGCAGGLQSRAIDDTFFNPTVDNCLVALNQTAPGTQGKRLIVVNPIFKNSRGSGNRAAVIGADGTTILNPMIDGSDDASIACLANSLTVKGGKLSNPGLLAGQASVGFVFSPGGTSGHNIDAVIVENAADGAVTGTVTFDRLDVRMKGTTASLFTGGSVLSFAPPSHQQPVPTRTISAASDTPSYKDRVLVCNRATAQAITLPTGFLGLTFSFKRLGAGSVTITPASGTIDGAATYSIGSVGQAATLVHDGTNWQVF